MKRLPILAVTLVVVLMAAAAAAVGAGQASRDDDDGWGDRMGPGMMTRSSASTSESGYLAEMVAHHEEAVAAAGELARSDRPEMRAFGESIVAAQSAQIEQMTAWLAEWYPEQQPADDYEPMMRDLSGLSGDDLDRAFLEDMIGHHMTAVMMSQHLLMRGTDHEQVADLARSIRDTQRAEIVRMRRWLAQWFDTGWGGSGRHMGMGRGAGMGMGTGTWMGMGMMGGSWS